MNDCIKNVVTIKHHGRDIHGISYMPKHVEKCPVVIFSHGYNGTYADFIMNSEYLVSNGVGAYCFDLCAVIDNVKKWDKIDGDNIFLFGGSQGGLVTALVADERMDDIKGMLLLFPAFCIADDWNKRYPTVESIPDKYELWGMELGRTFFESIHGYDVFGHIGKFDKNIFIFHGDQDGIVALEYAKKASKLYPNVNIEIFPGEGHGFSEAGNRRVAEMTCDFVKANIK
jgi:uncharacterized protein